MFELWCYRWSFLCSVDADFTVQKPRQKVSVEAAGRDVRTRDIGRDSKMSNMSYCSDVQVLGLSVRWRSPVIFHEDRIENTVCKKGSGTHRMCSF